MENHAPQAAGPEVSTNKELAWSEKEIKTARNLIEAQIRLEEADITAKSLSWDETFILVSVQLKGLGYKRSPESVSQQFKHKARTLRSPKGRARDMLEEESGYKDEDEDDSTIVVEKPTQKDIFGRLWEPEEEDKLVELVKAYQESDNEQNEAATRGKKWSLVSSTMMKNDFMRTAIACKKHWGKMMARSVPTTTSNFSASTSIATGNIEEDASDDDIPLRIVAAKRKVTLANRVGALAPVKTCQRPGEIGKLPGNTDGRSSMQRVFRNNYSSSLKQANDSSVQEMAASKKRPREDEADHNATTSLLGTLPDSKKLNTCNDSRNSKSCHFTNPLFLNSANKPSLPNSNVPNSGEMLKRRGSMLPPPSLLDQQPNLPANQLPSKTVTENLPKSTTSSDGPTKQTQSTAPSPSTTNSKGLAGKETCITEDTMLRFLLQTKASDIEREINDLKFMKDKNVEALAKLSSRKSDIKDRSQRFREARDEDTRKLKEQFEKDIKKVHEQHRTNMAGLSERDMMVDRSLYIERRKLEELKTGIAETEKKKLKITDTIEALSDI